MGCPPPRTNRASLMVPMTAQPGDRPDYEQPPVGEVALAIQFQSAIGYRSHELAAFVERWSGDLPKVLEKPPLTAMTVDFHGPAVELRVAEEPETPRLWLMNTEESRLLQIQQDRLVVNWRKLPLDTPYPRYETIRLFVVEAWEHLTTALRQLGRPVPEPSICEVQYVNHLDERSGWRSVGDTPAVIAPWGGSMSDDFLPPARQAAMSLLFDLPDGRGWLAAEGRSGELRDTRKVLTLNLVARGRAASPDLEGALDFMDLAHDWIVRGFTSITTSEAHKHWRRKR